MCGYSKSWRTLRGVDLVTGQIQLWLLQTGVVVRILPGALKNQRVAAMRPFVISGRRDGFVAYLACCPTTIRSGRKHGSAHQIGETRHTRIGAHRDAVADRRVRATAAGVDRLAGARNSEGSPSRQLDSAAPGGDARGQTLSILPSPMALWRADFLVAYRCTRPCDGLELNSDSRGSR